MKTLTLNVLVAAAALASGVVSAAVSATDPYENFSSSWARATPGSYPYATQLAPRAVQPSVRLPTRTIVVDGSKGVVNVDHMAAVKFVDARGRSFDWQSAGPGTFRLTSIAPADFQAGSVWVAVVHPGDHTTR